MPKRWISYSRFGDGLVPRDDPAQSAFTRLEGVRLRRGAYVKRAGETQLGDVPTTNRVSTLLVAPFSEGEALHRCEKGAIYYYNAGTEVFDLISPAITYASDDAKVWRGAMIFDDWYVSQGERFDDGGLTNDGILKGSSPGATLTRVTDSPGARDLVAWGGRLWAIHVHDDSGAVIPYRVRVSDAGLPETWYSGGAGYVDLDTLGWAAQRGVVVSGRLFVLCGESGGGSVVMGTLSGLSSPIARFETIQGIGIYGPSTLVRVSSDRAFFLGHDGFYAISGGVIQPIADDEGVVQEVLTNLDPGYLHRAFAYYKPRYAEIVLQIPVSSVYAERYVYSLRTGRWTGPEGSTNRSAAAGLQVTIQDTWATTPESDTWEAGDDTAWEDSADDVGERVLVIGYADGKVFQEDESELADDGTAIPITIETGAETFENAQFLGAESRGSRTRQTFHLAARDDLKGVDRLLLFYRDFGAIDGVTVEISTDGATWTSVFSGTLPGGVTNSRRDYEISFAMKVGRQFFVRVSHSSATSDFLLEGLSFRVRWISEH